MRCLAIMIALLSFKNIQCMEAGAPVACVHTLDSEADMSIVTRRRMSNIDYMTWGDFQRMRKEYFNANKRLIFIGENKEEQVILSLARSSAAVA
ncbi:hypothetical protein PCANC_06521 [Puccinia coronata f. sp. avenae]|uniref:Uncharacterized protein n=1 Tax=Puccinia coronata f. sp. avenae TaxID=200324 RepID=A0A2N5VAP1_9BASI|nr:hypothetical protein PCANC_06035 [Puccinia coronata f. sp. avenae]PLW20936.1 hypothetical protein PCASD_13422 [Puccinia coronata f. sp. avenae]PLW46986.1 hypothetical protein PCANC_06521 [Puccinia coronata f. sp. avenae]PLW47192.1 hypothetical protein PCASD_02361 [Puccinia coronata f. sp. avenae]